MVVVCELFDLLIVGMVEVVVMMVVLLGDCFLVVIFFLLLVCWYVDCVCLIGFEVCFIGVCCLDEMLECVDMFKVDLCVDLMELVKCVIEEDGVDVVIIGGVFFVGFVFEIVSEIFGIFVDLIVVVIV